MTILRYIDTPVLFVSLRLVFFFFYVVFIEVSHLFFFLELFVIQKERVRRLNSGKIHEAVN